jgi:diguanylate cyclase (GGDEF)-like protein
MSHRRCQGWEQVQHIGHVLNIKLRRFFRPPDPALIASGAGGVRSVAMTRVWFILVMAVAPVLGFLIRGVDADIEIRLAALALMIALFYSLITCAMLRRRGWRPSRSEAYLTSTFDLTLVTGTLLLLGLAVDPERVIHSEAVWAVYLLVIMTSALRLDVRVCLYMGVMAIVQYLAMVVVLELVLGDLMVQFDRVIQLARVVLMLAATALAIGIVNRSRSLMTISGYDSLTGLATRRYFNQRLADELLKARQLRRPLSLILFDLDHFKRINDAHGHEAGDRVLIQIANLLLHGKRPGDFLARWGGEEMVMILPNTDLFAATQVAERLVQAVRSTSFQTASGDVRITASAGVAERSSDCDDPESLFHFADLRMLQAKKSGRDRVVDGRRERFAA